MDLETLAWLLTDAGRRLLEEATRAWVEHGGDPVRAATAVRRLESDPDRAAAAPTQVQLRARAVAKFGDLAPLMFFTPDALEQATRLRVAEHRAARLAAARPTSVIDLGCGIGGDLMAFARAGLTAAGVDLDPVRVAVAQANLAALGLPGAVQVADATTIDVRRLRRGLRRPARRGARGRVFDADGWTPPWPFVLELLTGAAVVKVAPGIPHDDAPRRRRGRVGQRRRRGEGGGALVAAPAPPTRRRATVIGDGRARHPHRRGRPVRRAAAAGARRSAASSTSPTAPSSGPGW